MTGQHSLAISWDPVISLPQAIAVAVPFVLAAIWLATRSSTARAWTRSTLIALRSGGVLLVAFCWLNPGRWIEESRDLQRSWTVLLDRSASMGTEEAPGVTRWQVAREAAARLSSASAGKGQLTIEPFSAQLEEKISPESDVRPDGQATDLSRALEAALHRGQSALAGVVVISDGRVNPKAKLEDLALRARGRSLPIHVIPVATSWGARDLSLTAAPRQVTSFRGQPVKLSAMLENKGLGPIKPAVSLLDAEGRVLETKAVALTEGAHGTVTFDLANIPSGGGDYRLQTGPWPGEQIPSNNADTVRVNVLASKTRVLLLEGAPYWDSKFLAQLLRQQDAVEVLTVHRLNDERYFRVEASGAEPLLSPDTVFPQTAEALGRYDLIVFGKGSEGFLTPQRIAALQGFVRDQGGALLFARGKSYSGRFAPLEALEPVEWGEALSTGFRFTPLPDAGANLFGAALPASDDRVWAALPPLQDVYTIARLRPFTRVLAEGTTEGLQTRVPLLVARRLGRGMVSTVNADGLWRWDFRPEAREQGGVYQQFWVQLMEWCATYSEFRPGQDFAVRLREATAQPGQSVRALVSYRGANSAAAAPVIHVWRDGKRIGDTLATALPAADGSREWVAAFSPEQPGRYLLRVADRNTPEREEGEASLTVQALPGEMDDLRPDAEALGALARDAGGQVFTPEQTDALAQAMWATQDPAQLSKPRWESAWLNWWMVAALAGTFGSEWWIRRREGLL